MKELANTPEGQSGIAKINVRIDEAAAEHIKQAEKAADAAAMGGTEGNGDRAAAEVAENLKFVPFREAEQVHVREPEPPHPEPDRSAPYHAHAEGNEVR